MTRLPEWWNGWWTATWIAGAAAIVFALLEAFGILGGGRRAVTRLERGP
jgi:hypothetical protein